MESTIENEMAVWQYKIFYLIVKSEHGQYYDPIVLLTQIFSAGYIQIYFPMKFYLMRRDISRVKTL